MLRDVVPRPEIELGHAEHRSAISLPEQWSDIPFEAQLFAFAFHGFFLQLYAERWVPASKAPKTRRPPREHRPRRTSTTSGDRDPPRAFCLSEIRTPRVDVEGFGHYRTVLRGGQTAGRARAYECNVRAVLGIAAAIALLVAAVAATTLLDDDGDGADVVGVRIAGAPSTVRGVGHFEQDDERLTGFVVVWGLEPNSTHAVHFHGPDSSCGTSADPVAVHPDLTADGNGVAHTEVDIAAEPRLLDGGYYYNVHDGPSSQAKNPEIACGDIEP